MLRTLSLLTALSVVPHQAADRDCLLGKERCYEDVTCAQQLRKLHKVCDLEESCDFDEHTACQSTRVLLRNSSYFRGCTCATHNAETCLEIRDMIFQSHCSEIETIVTSEHEDYSRYATYRKRRTTCIGKRKQCLLDEKCGHYLDEFRDVCKEKRKNGTCISEDRSRCFKVMEELRPWGLFDCECRHDMRKEESRSKCLRLQSHIAHNVCLVTIPYLIYSTNPYERPYADLVSMIMTFNEEEATTDLNTDSSCVRAFQNCQRNPSCRPRMEAFMTACRWDKSQHKCARDQCLDAIQQFYLMVRPEQAQALFFCTCYHGDRLCEAVREGVRPTCINVADPPPACDALLETCRGGADCRVRRNALDKFCEVSPRDGGCLYGDVMCRNAQVGVMGTIVTANCTCALVPEVKRASCLHAQKALTERNTCMVRSAASFHAPADAVEPTVWSDGVISSGYEECMGELTQKTSMTSPTVIRVYDNDSDCTDLCKCLHNGTMTCRRLPCKPNYSCKVRHLVYAHGSAFEQAERGTCRCIRGEVVCAKAAHMDQKSGFFLHLGYSVGDQYLVEGNSGIKFHASRISDKLQLLLNSQHSDGQWSECSLTLHHQVDGNMVYRIQASTRGVTATPIVVNPHVCTSQAKHLENMINSRSRAIITDAELSIIKVAWLQRITIHRSSAKSQQDVRHDQRHNRASGACVRRRAVTWFVCGLVVVITAVFDVS